MHINPISMYRNSNINFQKRDDNKQVQQPSMLKNAAKAIVIVPFLIPIMTSSCEREHNFEFENVFDNCYRDTVARDSVHEERHTRAIQLAEEDTLDIIG